LPATVEKRSPAAKDKRQDRLFYGAFDSLARRQNQACRNWNRYLEEGSAFHVGGFTRNHRRHKRRL